MVNYVLSVNERKTSSKILIDYLKYLSEKTTDVNIILQKKAKCITGEMLTPEEIKLVDKSIKSGPASLDELKNFLRQ